MKFFDLGFHKLKFEENMEIALVEKYKVIAGHFKFPVQNSLDDNYKRRFRNL